MDTRSSHRTRRLGSRSKHPEIRLLTDEEKTTTVSLSIRPEYNVYVQRLHLRVQLCSVEDPAKRTEVELELVVVPRVGGPVVHQRRAARSPSAR